MVVSLCGFNCISLMTNDVEYVFSACLPSVYILFGEVDAGSQLEGSQFSPQVPLHVVSPHCLVGDAP